jgi:menaquinone-specific isochorismate synthase
MQTREGEMGLAWLAGESVRKGLAIHTRSTSPSPDLLSFFAPDFSLRSTEPWLLGEEIPYALPVRESLPAMLSRAEPSSADFACLFEDVAARIRAGEFEKVVPMVHEEFEFASPLSSAMFASEFLPGQFSYGFQCGSEGMVGVTPEILFSVEHGLLKTMALAGTGIADGPSLLDDEKEMHEHRLVVRHIEGELKFFGDSRIGQTTERVYGALKHLYTPLEFKLDRVPKFEDLVRRLHPTAALGGWPRKPAVQWLENQTFHQARGRFGAPFGFQEGTRLFCVVAIRNVQWIGSCMKVAAGCGVVEQSQVLKEWKELELKRQSIFRALGVNL